VGATPDQVALGVPQTPTAASSSMIHEAHQARRTAAAQNEGSNSAGDAGGPLVITATMVDDEEDMEERIRQQILENAVEAQVMRVEPEFDNNTHTTATHSSSTRPNPNDSAYPTKSFSEASSTKPQKKRLRLWIIGGLVLLAVVLAGVIGAILATRDSSSSSSSSASAEQPTNPGTGTGGPGSDEGCDQPPPGAPEPGTNECEADPKCATSPKHLAILNGNTDGATAPPNDCEGSGGGDGPPQDGGGDGPPQDGGGGDGPPQDGGGGDGPPQDGGDGPPPDGGGDGPPPDGSGGGDDEKPEPGTQECQDRPKCAQRPEHQNIWNAGTPETRSLLSSQQDTSAGWSRFLSWESSRRGLRGPRALN